MLRRAKFSCRRESQCYKMEKNLYPNPENKSEIPVTIQPTATVISNDVERDELGLDYFVGLDELTVRQEISKLETITGHQVQNQYYIDTSGAKRTIQAKEKSNCFSRCCLSVLRPFQMNIYDNYGKNILRFERPFRCQGCLFPCCPQTMSVFTQQGHFLGKITERWSIFSQKFTVEVAPDQTILSIHGPCFPFSCGGSVDFSVTTADGATNVAKISKKWSGCVTEFFTDADLFVVTYEKHIDTKTKALVLGACMLIEYMYFEKQTSTIMTLACVALQCSANCLT